jgi:Family of unknown function (DUF5677)
VNQTDTQLRDRALELMTRIDVAILETTPGEPLHIKKIDAPLFSTFWRLKSLHHAIHLLLVSEHLDEALILWRSLFEDAARLRYILSKGEDRAAYAIHCLLTEIEDRRGLLLKPGGVDMDADAVREALAEEQRNVQAFQARLGIAKPEKPPKTEAAARHLGWQAEYWNFCFAHKFVHGSDVAQLFRRRFT